MLIICWDKDFSFLSEVMFFKCNLQITNCSMTSHRCFKQVTKSMETNAVFFFCLDFMSDSTHSVTWNLCKKNIVSVLNRHDHSLSVCRSIVLMHVVDECISAVRTISCVYTVCHFVCIWRACLWKMPWHVQECAVVDNQWEVVGCWWCIVMLCWYVQC